MIQDAEGRSFTFNGDDKQTEVRNASNQVIGNYFYDGSGARVKKVTNTETTVFVYDAGGALAAEYSTATPTANPTTSYLTTDHLGTPRVITDSSGQVIARRDFMPFGEELGAGVGQRTESLKYSYAGSDNIRKRFTGYEKDDETGLDFAEARMYQNRHGRFTAPDPLLASARATDPQTFNRYIYTSNNPINYTDPSGLSWCQAKDGTVSFTGSGTACGDGFTNVDDKVLQHTEGSGGFDSNGNAYGVGDLLVFNPDGTRNLLTNPTPNQAAQIAALTGTEVQATYEEIITTTAAEIGNTLLSAASTYAEDNGFTPLPVEHNTAGRIFGHLLALGQGIGEAYVGGGLIAAGSAGEIGGLVLDATGVGAVIGIPVGAASAAAIVTGAVVAGHGVFVSANTIVNIYNQSTLEPGPHAGESIPARNSDRHFNDGERESINNIGNETGCHTCGTKDPGTKSGNFVPDHQPPSKLNPSGKPQRLYPQCLGCSKKQGGQVRGRTR